MESFPNKGNKPEKKRMSRASKATAFVSNAALALGIGAAASKYDEVENSQPISNTDSRYETSAPQEHNTDTLPAYTVEAPQETPQVMVSKPDENTVRPKERPEDWHSIGDMEHPLFILDFMVREEAQRLGLDEEVFKQRIDKLLFMFVDIESDWDPYAQNEKSSATGYYQYLTENNTPGKQDGSVHTAINRMYDILERHQVQDADPSREELAWATTLYENPKEIINTPLEAQQVLVFSDLVQQTGTDELFTQLVEGSQEEQRAAALELYYKGHHTQPNPRVIKNASRDVEHYFPSNS